MKNASIRPILGFFAVIGAILVIVAAESVRNIDRSAESSDWVNHTHAVMIEVKGILGDLHAADGAALTFAVSGNPRSNAACRAALADLAEDLAVAKAMTRHEPSQSGQVAQLETLANARADLDRDILHAATPEAARSLLGPAAGVKAMDEVRAGVDRLTAEETALLEARDRISVEQARRMRWTVWAGAAIDVALLAGVAWLIWDDLRARRAALTALETANLQLEARVAERTSALSAANVQLTTDNFERRWANQALEHQLRYNQVIIDSISDLVFVLTKAVNISRINPAVLQLTGLESQEVVNQPLASVVRLQESALEVGEPLVDPLVLALRQGRDLRDQPALLEDKRGRQTRAVLSFYAIRDQDKVVGGVAILRVVL